MRILSATMHHFRVHPKVGCVRHCEGSEPYCAVRTTCEGILTHVVQQVERGQLPEVHTLVDDSKQ